MARSAAIVGAGRARKTLQTAAGAAGVEREAGDDEEEDERDEDWEECQNELFSQLPLPMAHRRRTYPVVRPAEAEGGRERAEMPVAAALALLPRMGEVPVADDAVLVRLNLETTLNPLNEMVGRVDGRRGVRHRVVVDNVGVHVHAVEAGECLMEDVFWHELARRIQELTGIGHDFEKGTRVRVRVVVDEVHLLAGTREEAAAEPAHKAREEGVWDKQCVRVTEIVSEVNTHCNAEHRDAAWQ